VVRVSAAVVLDQRELDLARFVRLADGPIPAANVCRAILDYREKQAEGKYQKSQGSTRSHKTLL
jgi:hypothetical protein